MKLLLLASLLLCAALPLHAKVQVVWGTDAWEGYTEPQGRGFYQELIALVFPGEKFDVDIQYLAWQRVGWELKRRNIDMTGALHKNSEYYFSEMPVLSERILALSNQGVSLDGSAESLQSFVGAYRNGYEDDIFHEIVPESVSGVPVDSPSMAINLLKQDKIDYYVELESMLSDYVDDVNANSIMSARVGTFQLYWAFVKSQKGKYIKRHFDRRLAALRKNGALSALYKKYGLVLPR